MRVDVEDLSVEIAGATLVRDVTVRAGSGRLVGLVGPNGSGKSTLLRCVYRALRPTAGTVRLDGDDLHAMTPREGARRLAALPQEVVTEFAFTVAEVVAMGRLPHQSAAARTSASDREQCALALKRVGAEHLVDRTFQTLSGGEKQRVLIARALAQEPRVLVLDEPTNHLDIAQQLEVLSLVRDRAAGDTADGMTVLTALHDLNLAAAYCDELYVIARGAIVASGPPGEVLGEELLADVFGVRAHRVTHPGSGSVRLLFDRLP
ncbi:MULTISPECIES: ABC transporter ATP-binding protein [unclassified Streptomyces]|uniref:ABC transporter ATP-binding protein n=1 Tax=unclassified Streptomyces TaxID=2593676 RepID=UPI0022B6443F|nr:MULTISPECIES: ABC transporter ATP-binding protein [unclassified Streptomyces]MCZ7417445.1 ABC transporter ATP-binding protein [Streptomyces sp. WMMC897]MCZ7432727.1 ABC transporter ATP-binding protein [Streptomyces sp. WMMC1477]